jgi:hypothetical protein
MAAKVVLRSTFRRHRLEAAADVIGSQAPEAMTSGPPTRLPTAPPSTRPRNPLRIFRIIASLPVNCVVLPFGAAPVLDYFANSPCKTRAREQQDLFTLHFVSFTNAGQLTLLTSPIYVPLTRCSLAKRRHARSSQLMTSIRRRPASF